MCMLLPSIRSAATMILPFFTIDCSQRRLRMEEHLLRVHLKKFGRQIIRQVKSNKQRDPACLSYLLNRAERAVGGAVRSLQRCRQFMHPDNYASVTRLRMASGLSRWRSSHQFFQSDRYRLRCNVLLGIVAVKRKRLARYCHDVTTFSTKLQPEIRPRRRWRFGTADSSSLVVCPVGLEPSCLCR